MWPALGGVRITVAPRSASHASQSIRRPQVSSPVHLWPPFWLGALGLFVSSFARQVTRGAGAKPLAKDLPGDSGAN
jgi:hypothetical protein